MVKLTAAFLAFLLAAIAMEVAFPMGAAKAVPASWIDKVVNEREIVLQPSAGAVRVKQPVATL